MSPGKLVAQAGHAYLGAFLQTSPDVTAAYHADGIGTKVCLQARLPALLKAKDEAKRAGIPHFLVVDSGCENFFGGQPDHHRTGHPVSEDQLPALRRLQLY
jgi:peptidyl-tRNA hydrolase